MFAEAKKGTIDKYKRILVFIEEENYHEALKLFKNPCSFCDKYKRFYGLVSHECNKCPIFMAEKKECYEKRWYKSIREYRNPRWELQLKITTKEKERILTTTWAILTWLHTIKEEVKR